jgi:hypothetical protein|tara:strand:+ start:275 stop:490 length:216 start_codon:yes stop_codon:yes gene_type:complete
MGVFYFTVHTAPNLGAIRKKRSDYLREMKSLVEINAEAAEIILTHVQQKHIKKSLPPSKLELQSTIMILGI